jgi:hypothetical protein
MAALVPDPSIHDTSTPTSCSNVGVSGSSPAQPANPSVAHGRMDVMREHLISQGVAPAAVDAIAEHRWADNNNDALLSQTWVIATVAVLRVRTVPSPPRTVALAMTQVWDNKASLLLYSHWVSCVPTKPIYLQNKNRTATCFCHTILEFAAAEKSLALHGRKIGINSSWTGV